MSYDSHMICRAIEVAARCHAGQVDKAGEPYILHCLRVMENVKTLPFGQIVPVQMAAVLHDVVEDCGVDLSYIEEQFGPEVRALVDAVSRRKDEVYNDYVTRIKLAGYEARAIKMADLIDNMDPRRFHSDAPYERMVKTLRRLKTSRI